MVGTESLTLSIGIAVVGLRCVQLGWSVRYDHLPIGLAPPQSRACSIPHDGRRRAAQGAKRQKTFSAQRSTSMRMRIRRIAERRQRAAAPEGRARDAPSPRHTCAFHRAPLPPCNIAAAGDVFLRASACRVARLCRRTPPGATRGV